MEDYNRQFEPRRKLGEGKFGYVFEAREISSGVTWAIKQVAMLWILKTFSPENRAKILPFFAQTTASFCKNLIVALVFEKKRHFFRRKL
jgi:serine/threonine protein kinase